MVVHLCVTYLIAERSPCPPVRGHLHRQVSHSSRLHWVPLFSPVYRNTERIKEHKSQLIFKTEVRMNLSNAQNGEVCIKVVYIPNPFLTLPSTKQLCVVIGLL